MRKKISIIVPIYNKQKYLYACLESLRKQTFKEIQIIMIDDGSTDKSEEICQDFVNKDSRFEYYFYENSGCSKSRNRGISKAHGKFILFIDADDCVEINFCEELYNKIEISQSDLVVCSIQIVKENKKLGKKIVQKIKNKSDFISKNKIWRNSASNKIFKRELLEKFKIKFCEKSHSWEDMGFVLKYLSLIEKIETTNNTKYNYCRNSDSTTLGKKFDCTKIDQRFNIVNDTFDFIKYNSATRFVMKSYDMLKLA